jgi:hypothetical protein
MKKILVLIIIMLFALAGLAYGQSEKDAIKALKKLQAKIESGISYQKYREALGDTNSEVKLFLESKNATKDLALTQSIKKIMSNYQDAADLWQTIIEWPGRSPGFSPDEKPSPSIRIPEYDKLIETSKRMFKKYPKAYDKCPSYSTYSPILRKEITARRAITLDEFLAIIWDEASKEVKKLSID